MTPIDVATIEPPTHDGAMRLEAREPERSRNSLVALRDGTAHHHRAVLTVSRDERPGRPLVGRFPLLTVCRWTGDQVTLSIAGTPASSQVRPRGPAGVGAGPRSGPRGG